MTGLPRSASPLSSGSCFVTGTDTGVGKTVVTAALVVCLKRRGLSVGVLKPVETGYEAGSAGPSDAERFLTCLAGDDPGAFLSLYQFSAPIAPLAAARQVGAVISLDRIVEAYGRLAARYRAVLIEGAGGLCVPLTDREDMRDLIERLALPVVLVGRCALGGVNHALLTLEALRARKIPVLALVLNQQIPYQAALDEDLQAASTVALLKERSGVPVIGPLPYLAGLAGGGDVGVSELSRDPGIETLADLVSRDGL
ncbi:MAG: dethiobiotin synthase [Nitrospirae bacterium]|nr:MAG: dethiobiotin synthase [Nitrospirota bacterium]